MPAIPRSEPFAQRACPLGVCDGSGWILGPEDVARPCECREQRLRRGRVRGVASAIPPRYRGVSFDRPPVSDMSRDMATRHVVNAVRAFVDDLDENLAAGKGMWLMGNTGTGKTTLGMLAAKHALAAGRSVAVYFAPKLLTQIRQTYQATDTEDAYDAFFRRLTSVDLLYIDDLGSERHTDWVVEQLYALVNERYENQRSVLVTSNAGRNVEEGRRALEEQIGSRTVSRLIEICDDPLPLFGPDRREQARAVGA
ncbi:MAG TPA: ATP-binding protein [Solirubrobacterales bacterium]|jgi:DNA replication protein DnaC|nr:ATP-binding protein [Solirubrobacterales bacterium]